MLGIAFTPTRLAAHTVTMPARRRGRSLFTAPPGTRAVTTEAAVPPPSANALGHRCFKSGLGRGRKIGGCTNAEALLRTLHPALVGVPQGIKAALLSSAALLLVSPVSHGRGHAVLRHHPQFTLSMLHFAAFPRDDQPAATPHAIVTSIAALLPRLQLALHSVSSTLRRTSNASAFIGVGRSHRTTAPCVRTALLPAYRPFRTA